MKRFRTLSWQEQAPAPGLGVVITPSPVQRVKLLSLVVPFTTDAVAGNRAPFVTLADPNGIVVFETGNSTLQAASVTQDYVISPAFSSTAFGRGPVNSACLMGFPDMWLPPGWVITIGAKQIDPADQFGVASFAAHFAEDVWDEEEDQALALAFLSSLTP